MKIAGTVARILLGLMFTFFGLNGFFLFLPVPPMSGNVAEFLHAIFSSHFSMFVFGVQLIAGLMLLTNQYVPLALVTLAAILANILAYHVTMLPQGLPLALITTLIWIVAALPHRAHFAPLLARTATLYPGARSG